jgi:hypothetical protein
MPPLSRSVGSNATQVVDAGTPFDRDEASTLFELLMTRGDPLQRLPSQVANMLRRASGHDTLKRSGRARGVGSRFHKGFQIQPFVTLRHRSQTINKRLRNVVLASLEQVDPPEHP